MKLKDLINSHHWLSVELTILRLYPDQETMIDEYRNVFEKLQQLEPDDYNMSIVLVEHDCDQDDEREEETYVDVSGRKTAKEENSITNSHAIEFVEWKYWLGMDLAIETTTNFTELEIIAHCLFEITFISYEEKEIKKKFNALKRQVKEIRNMTAEERKAKTISFDELLKQLDDEDDSE